MEIGEADDRSADTTRTGFGDASYKTEEKWEQAGTASGPFRAKSCGLDLRHDGSASMYAYAFRLIRSDLAFVFFGEEFFAMCWFGRKKGVRRRC